MTGAFIEIEGLVKRFGQLTAVDGISFSVAKGEVLGFLGPNGAGKSTTMKMITGFLLPTEGTIRICGRDTATDMIGAQSYLGYLPEGAPAYPDMTPRQFLFFIADVRGFTRDTRHPVVARAIARTQLDSVLDRPIETLSKGFKRRVGLAQAILHDPPVLIMDEPTDGLDPNQKLAVRRLIAGMAREKAIIISTHILEEVDAICTRAQIIDKGRIVGDGTPTDLTARSRYHNAVTIHLGADNIRAARDSFRRMRGVADVSELIQADGSALFTLFPAERNLLIAGEVHALVSDRGWDVRALYAEKGRLDDVFRAMTTSDAADAAMSGTGTDDTRAA